MPRGDIAATSSGDRRPGFSRILSGTPILPTSCSSAATSTSRGFFIQLHDGRPRAAAERDSQSERRFADAWPEGGMQAAGHAEAGLTNLFS